MIKIIYERRNLNLKEFCGYYDDLRLFLPSVLPGIPTISKFSLSLKFSSGFGHGGNSGVVVSGVVSVDTVDVDGETTNRKNTIILLQITIHLFHPLHSFMKLMLYICFA